MHTNEALIHQFYTSFQNKDYKGMQACYADDASFSDPVFQQLQGGQIKKMWEMLCKNARDFSLEFKNVSADDTKGSADWVATYIFSGTGNKVVNRVSAEFVFRDGKILKHTDTFSFYAWAKQALGGKGALLGWTPLVKNKVRGTAMKNLENFMQKKDGATGQ